jgi:hypothetical protein
VTQDRGDACGKGCDEERLGGCGAEERRDAGGEEALRRVEEKDQDAPARAEDAIRIRGSDVPAARRPEVDAASAADPEAVGQSAE